MQNIIIVDKKEELYALSIIQSAFEIRLTEIRYRAFIIKDLLNK